MNLIKNIQRISWRLSSGKQFTPNDSDIDAFNEIITWINKEKEDRINQNRYFAKIVVYAYINELRFYKENSFSEKKLQEVLGKPLEFWYEEFKKEMNQKELNETLSFLGITDQWESNKNESKLFDINKIRQDAKNNEELIKEHKELLTKAVLGVWDIEDISNKLNFYITELLTNYANKP